jgi:hypothetical protein
VFIDPADAMVRASIIADWQAGTVAGAAVCLPVKESVADTRSHR